MKDSIRKMGHWVKAKWLFVLFLCLELLVLSLGGKAFYAVPVEVSNGESVPTENLYPFPPPKGWSVQRQWFTLDGDLLNRIVFSAIADGAGNGGFTVSMREESGEVLLSGHYAPEELTEEFLEFNIQQKVRYGARYCFEVIADEGGSDWSVPYFYAPGAELSWLEDAEVDGVPMEDGGCYLFLSFYYARISYAAVALHAAALLAGAAYLLFCCTKKDASKGHSADVAVLCAACVCAAGQFFLCKDYFLNKALFICLPCVLLAGIAFFILLQKGWLGIRLRISLRSWKSAVFLLTALLSSAMFLMCIKGRGLFDIGNHFYVALFAFLVFLFFGMFSIPRLDGLCARFPWLICAAQSVLIFLQMEVADQNPLDELKFGFIIFNIVTIFAVLALLWAIFANFRRALLTGIVLFAVWGIANYLTVAFRGLPIAPNDLMSAGTALNVLGDYQLEWNISLASVFMLIALELLLLFRIPAKTNDQKKKDKRLPQRGAVMLCTILFFWQGYFGSLCPIDPSELAFIWTFDYYPRGYVAISIEKMRQLFITAPAGYSAAEVRALYEAQNQQANDESPDSKPYPNIILILNESWFDWRQVTEFETDRPVMPFIDSLENCIKGFAVGPQDRSGTSLSEYELLTSNSLSMLPGITPFTQRNLEGNYSVASYLESLGYTTAAMHPASSINYNRRLVYPQLKFDRIFFEGDALFQDANDVRGRVADESAFQAAKTILDEKEAGAPALVYLLTIQNHGGYILGNECMEEEYRITIQKGFDLCREGAEEYLSLLRCMDDAFEKLIGEIENEAEPTIVCMVGDHGPTLGAEIESPYEGYEWSQRQRGTPFIIWANYPIDVYNAGYISMVQLMPLLMKTADLPLSPYYQTILDVSEEYPVLGAAFYQDADGNFGNYSFTETVPQSALLKQYFYFEYNSLLSQEKRIPEIFLAG